MDEQSKTKKQWVWRKNVWEDDGKDKNLYFAATVLVYFNLSQNSCFSRDQHPSFWFIIFIISSNKEQELPSFFHNTTTLNVNDKQLMNLQRKKQQLSIALFRVSKMNVNQCMEEKGAEILFHSSVLEAQYSAYRLWGKSPCADRLSPCRLTALGSAIMQRSCR